MRILVKFLIIISINSCIQTFCGYAKEFKKNEFEGIVKEKVLNSYNHGQKIIKIWNGNEIQKIYVTGDLSSLFDYIKKNDKIQKDKNTNFVKVFRENKKAVIFEVDFGCHE